MLIELTSQQRDFLLRLVDEEIADLGPEIHHTRTYKDPLKEQKREIVALRDLLAKAGATTQVVAEAGTGMECSLPNTNH